MLPRRFAPHGLCVLGWRYAYLTQRTLWADPTSQHPHAGTRDCLAPTPPTPKGWAVHLGLAAAVVARAVGVTRAVVPRGVLRGPGLLAARRLDADRLVAGIKRKVS